MVNNSHPINIPSPFTIAHFHTQVANSVKAKVRARLSSVCGDSLYCDVADLEAVCREVLVQQMIDTNEIFRRRRRGEWLMHAEYARRGLNSAEEVSGAHSMDLT